MRDRLVSFMAARAMQSGDRRVLLIIDEAQNLKTRHYNWLIGIHNMLDLLGVNLIVLLVGQNDLLARRNAFVRAEMNQIVGRFMLHAHEFRGVRSAEDLHETMKSYDERTEYPAGSGWSFTRYFAPQSFGTGWRLAHLSTEFWHAFREAQAVGPKGRRTDIPMQYVCRSFDHFLINAGNQRMTDQEAVRRLVRESIAASSYRDTLFVS